MTLVVSPFSPFRFSLQIILYPIFWGIVLQPGYNIICSYSNNKPSIFCFIPKKNEVIGDGVSYCFTGRPPRSQLGDPSISDVSPGLGEASGLLRPGSHGSGAGDDRGTWTAVGLRPARTKRWNTAFFGNHKAQGISLRKMVSFSLRFPKLGVPPNHSSHGWPWLSIETHRDLGIPYDLYKPPNMWTIR